MAALTNQAIVRSGTGLVASYTAPSASDTFVPGSRTFYYAKVTSTSTTFTFQVPAGKGVDYSGLAVTPLSVTRATAGDVLIGPFPADVFADPTTGLCTVTTNQQSGVTVAVFDLGN
jgi:hypothetical protein